MNYCCDKRIKRDICNTSSLNIKKIVSGFKTEKFGYKNHFLCLEADDNGDKKNLTYGFNGDSFKEYLPSIIGFRNSSIFDINIPITDNMWSKYDDQYKLTVNTLPNNKNDTFVFYYGTYTNPSLSEIKMNCTMIKCFNKKEKTFLFDEKMPTLRIVGQIYTDFETYDINQIVAIQNVAIQDLLKENDEQDKKITDLEKKYASIEMTLKAIKTKLP